MHDFNLLYKMRKLLLIAFTCFVMGAFAAPVYNMPSVRIQPNGDTLYCFVSGDEFYNRLHDAKNYTIVQNHKNGYWVYAVKEAGELVASNYVAGSIDPSSVGIEPGLMISERELRARHAAWEIPEEYKTKAARKNASNIGTLNNVVIFVRFQGDSPILTSMDYINSIYNDSLENSVSLYNYFKHSSYGKLSIRTYYYPEPIDNTVLSYEDIYPREYYMPYDSTSNPQGYQTESERGLREFDLLERAVNYVNTNSPVDPELNIDNDNDGDIDNISFIVKGTYTGWSDLLWPHKWSLYDRYVAINGKRVNTFNFLLEGAGSAYFGASTICHEMFHTLSAPDLYHYYQYTYLHPVGSWDLMEQNANPPQHMNAYMKMKYGHWIDSIPELRRQGTYTLHSISNPSNQNNCWKIQSPDPSQFYLLEYRNNHELFETGIPGTGLLIYRIDTRFSGNESFDNEYYFDEVYLFRPDGGTLEEGHYNQAHLNPAVNRSEFTPSTNPHPWLTQGIEDTTFEIRNVMVFGDSLTFDYIVRTGCRIPVELNVRQVTGNSADLTWSGFSDGYEIQLHRIGYLGVFTDTTSNTVYHAHDLTKASEYEWRVRSICAGEGEQEFSPWSTFRTNNCYNAQEVAFEHFGNEFQNNVVPFYVAKNYSYTQQIVLAEEMDGPVEITKMSFKYASGGTLSNKSNCTIYMGHTDKTMFANTYDFVPFADLQVVYEGPLSFTTGWNDIIFDEPFQYDGENNMVIAIDDNSNAVDDSKKFYAVSTDEYMTLSYSSTNRNPNPSDLSGFSGMKNRQKYRSMMHFLGCVEGADDSVSISTIEVDPILEVITSQNNIFVTTSENMNVRLYDIMGRQMCVSPKGYNHHFTVPVKGVYLIKTGMGSARKIVVQ